MANVGEQPGSGGIVLEPGVVLQGRYEILGVLGTGAQATVFEALDRRLGIRVAVKRSSERTGPLREAFIREARMLASLRHPNLPIVSDHFLEHGGLFLVLELVRGEDLEARVTRLGGPCGVEETLGWVDQLLDALEYLHAQTPPIVHRDIKPSNLTLRADGRLLLLDFGLAKGRPPQDPSDDGRPLVSVPGYSHGYAPVEQVSGQGTDPRADVYAVGATLYYLLSSVVPPPSNVRLREHAANGDPLLPLESINPVVPGRVAGLIHRALELRPDRRFQAVAELRRALARARADLQGGSALSPPDDEDGQTLDDLPTIIRHSVPLIEEDAAPLLEDVETPPSPRGVRGAWSQAPGSTSESTTSDAWLALAHGEQAVDRWRLSANQVLTIGRSSGPLGVMPDIDLWPDRRVSRTHARISFSGGHWRVEDAGSKHGTRVDGRALAAGEAAMLRPWSEIQLGDTILFLAPDGWYRLNGRGVVIDLDMVGAASSSLAHAGLPVLGKVVARSRTNGTRPPGKLEIGLERCIEPLVMTVPALEQGASVTLAVPPIVAHYDVLEDQIERSQRVLTVLLDGEVPAGGPVACWLLPHNEWSTLPEHRRALATFVLPNHPDVAAVCLEVVSEVGPTASAEVTVAALFDVLAEGWQITYRIEPPHWASDSQKVRLPHHVLLDDAGRRGEGTCLDLALLLAACLENLGLQPLLAILDFGEWWHALVGCWDPPSPGLEPILLDRAALLDGSIWLDPTALTRDPELRRTFPAARAEGERHLRERPLLFGLDVAAARQEHVTPLPFAGQPTWSAPAARAIEAAVGHARSGNGQLCSAALLAGLLTAGDGLTRRLVSATLGDPDLAARAIVGALPPALPGGDPTPGYRQVLTLARSRAKDDGSPSVLEVHLLGALLAIRSASQDRALARLGTDQARLARALRTQVGLESSGLGSLG